MRKIDQLVLINYKKHEKYVGEFKGNSFVVAGVNGAGKTSVLEAIKRLIGQKTDKPEVPIRQGAENASVGLYISNNGNQFMVEERYSLKGRGRLRFYRINGNSRDELQPALERLREAIGIPIDFMPLIDKSGEDQFSYLKENLGMDISQWEAAFNNVYEDRTLINREIKALEARVENPQFYMPKADLETYSEYKDAKELLAKKIDTSGLLVEKNNADWQDRERAKVEESIKAYKQEEAELERLLKEVRNKIDRSNSWLQENPPADQEVIKEKIRLADRHNASIDAEIRTVTEHNKLVEKAAYFVQITKDLEEKRKKSSEFSVQLKAMEGELFSRLTKFDLGAIVPGLELKYSRDVDTGKVKEAGLFYEGLPLHRTQHSYGKLLKVIIKLAAHFNADKLNFIPIGDWNLLDKKSQEEIYQFAKDNPDLGIQFGIEKVDDSAEIITEIVVM